MVFSQPISDVIQNRFSCRTYAEKPITQEKQQQLRDFLSRMNTGPLGTPLRFDLIAATQQDRQALRGLGTYGYIKNASAYLVGAMCSGDKNLEEYGYRLEQIILYATDLDLGTCWLGGTFTKSSFARKITLSRAERLPAVVSLGYIPDEAQARHTGLRQRIGADRRLPWKALFFDGRFDTALTREKAGQYAVPLEMVRIGPSASNKQPWRVIQAGQAFHFYLQRTQGYRSILTKLVGVEDMQRLDLGIAMCHFELTARELGLNGSWMIQEPRIAKPDDLTEYIVSWISDARGEEYDD